MARSARRGSSAKVWTIAIISGVLVVVLAGVAALAVSRAGGHKRSPAASGTATLGSAGSSSPTSPSASPSGSGSPSPSSSASSRPPTSAPRTTSTWPHPGDGTTGLPAGWKPKKTINGDLVITTAGAKIEDYEVHGSVSVQAPNVVVRHVMVIGGGLYTDCSGNTTFDHDAVRGTGAFNADPGMGPGSFTAIGVLIDNVTEGIRVGERDHCGIPTIRDSYVNVVIPNECKDGPPYPDWHGDGLQGYNGAGVTIVHSTIRMAGDPATCDGTSPFFWPDQGNGPATVNGLLTVGGVYYAFRMDVGGSVKGLLVAGGYAVSSCAQLSTWQAQSATVNLQSWQVSVGAPVPCGTT